MSFPPTLAFRDSLDTVAGKKLSGHQLSGQEPTQSNETTRILSENKSVKFNNDPVIYYYHPEIGIPSRSSIRTNYSIISTEPPSVYLNSNGNKECRCIFYLVPLLLFICLILIVLFFIFTFSLH
jgi:hypothetical protein